MNKEVDVDSCDYCDTIMKYRIYQYRAIEIIPTEDGGIFTRQLLSFCSPHCLSNWIFDNYKEVDSE